MQLEHQLPGGPQLKLDFFLCALHPRSSPTAGLGWGGQGRAAVPGGSPWLGGGHGALLPSLQQMVAHCQLCQAHPQPCLSPAGHPSPTAPCPGLAGCCSPPAPSSPARGTPARLTNPRPSPRPPSRCSGKAALEPQMGPRGSPPPAATGSCVVPAPRRRQEGRGSPPSLALRSAARWSRACFGGAGELFSPGLPAFVLCPLLAVVWHLPLRAVTVATRRWRRALVPSPIGAGLAASTGAWAHPTPPPRAPAPAPAVCTGHSRCPRAETRGTRALRGFAHRCRPALAPAAHQDQVGSVQQLSSLLPLHTPGTAGPRPSVRAGLAQLQRSLLSLGNSTISAPYLPPVAHGWRKGKHQPLFTISRFLELPHPLPLFLHPLLPSQTPDWMPCSANPWSSHNAAIPPPQREAPAQPQSCSPTPCLPCPCGFSQICAKLPLGEGHCFASATAPHQAGRCPEDL